jgi:tRNA A37 threonylcarbamoyltransferase TsaD
MEELAKKGKKLVELPYVVKGMDVSFAGLVTKAVRLFNDKKATVEDICFSLQEICFAMLAEVSERAMAHTGKNELLLIGGVAANKRLCQMLDIMCKERGAKFFAVPLEFAGDQAGMICWQGWQEYNAAKSKEKFNVKEADIYPYERTDEIEIIWK